MAYPNWTVSGKGAMARSGFDNAVSQKSKHNFNLMANSVLAYL